MRRAYMKDHCRIFPRIKIYKHFLPKEIRSSRTAAYQPATSTIHLTWSSGWRIIIDFGHELRHHFFGSLGEKLI